MSTPQDSPKRRKQKARRTRQLAEWRAKKEAGGKGPSRDGGGGASAKNAKKAKAK
jgi:hypothetical protein